MIRFGSYHDAYLPNRFGIKVSKGYHDSFIHHKEGFFIELFIGKWRPSIFIGLKDCP